MAILTVLRLAKFSYSSMSGTQKIPDEKTSEISLKSSDSKTSEVKDDEETPSRPSSPEVAIPVSENPYYKKLREFEIVLKYAAFGDKKNQPEPSISDIKMTNFLKPVSKTEWRYLLARYPNGPCYRIKVEDDDNHEIIFSRELYDGCKYHYSVLHAIGEDLGIDLNNLPNRVDQIDLLNLKTVEDLLLESRILTNSV